MKEADVNSEQTREPLPSRPLRPVESIGVAGSLFRLGLGGLGLAVVCFIIYGIFHVDLGAGVEEMASQLERGDPQTRALAAADILQVVRTTSANERKAAGIEDSILGRKLLVALRGMDRNEDDARLSIVVALGAMKITEGVPDLMRLIQGSKMVSARLRASAASSLGEIGDARAVPALRVLTRSDTAEVRRSAAMALGALRSKESVPDIAGLLDDNDLSVTWGAALALARLGDSRGRDVYRAMLNREFLDRRKDMNERDRAGVMIAALRAVSDLKLAEYVPQIQEVGRGDRNYQVRSEAMKTLERLERQK